jgi:hypothetical protein
MVFLAFRLKSKRALGFRCIAKRSREAELRQMVCGVRSAVRSGAGSVGARVALPLHASLLHREDRPPRYGAGPSYELGPTLTLHEVSAHAEFSVMVPGPSRPPRQRLRTRRLARLREQDDSLTAAEAELSGPWKIEPLPG